MWRFEMSRLTFGGLLAFVLLGLFVYAVVVALSVAYHCTSTCSLSDAAAALLETIGALVSAVVVSRAISHKAQGRAGHTSRGRRVFCGAEDCRESISSRLHSGVALFGPGFSHFRLGAASHGSSGSQRRERMARLCYCCGLCLFWNQP